MENFGTRVEGSALNITPVCKSLGKIMMLLGNGEMLWGLTNSIQDVFLMRRKLGT
jgi:hypothetical protein